MDAKRQEREERKQQLLRELAKLQVEEMGEDGRFDQTPHFSALERIGHQLGKRLGCEVHAQAAREAAARSPTQMACPSCGTLCDVTTQRRTIESIDGPTEITEPVADCRSCRRSFFPSADGDGAG
jgi:hypothetical protein